MEVFPVPGNPVETLLTEAIPFVVERQVLLGEVEEEFVVDSWLADVESLVEVLGY
jgi:hypothetical protein